MIRDWKVVKPERSTLTLSDDFLTNFAQTDRFLGKLLTKNNKADTKSGSMHWIDKFMRALRRERLSNCRNTRACGERLD